MATERRKASAWKLRIYVDAIHQAEATTDSEWIDAWIKHGDPAEPFVSRTVWLETLRTLALREAEKIMLKEAA